MNVENQVKYWIESSGEDLSTAGILFEKERYLHGLFFCHLAVEKILKALYVKIKHEFAPKTHNLLYLSELCNIDLAEEKKVFYSILMKYQIAGRYPDNIVSKTDSSSLMHYYNKTLEEVKWLKQKLNQ